MTYEKFDGDPGEGWVMITTNIQHAIMYPIPEEI